MQVYCELLARVPVTTTPAPLFEYLTPRGKALFKLFDEGYHKDDFQLRLFHEWEPLSLKRLILQFTQYSPSKGKAHVVAAAIRKTVNETIGEFEKSKSIVK